MAKSRTKWVKLMVHLALPSTVSSCSHQLVLVELEPRRGGLAPT